MLKRVIILYLITLLVLLAGCNKKPTDKDTTIYYSTQSIALEHFIEENSINGVELLETKKGEQLLLCEESENIFFIGEIIKNSDGYTIVKVTSSFSMANTLGVSWDFSTSKKNNYTVSLSTEDYEETPNFTPLEINEDYFVFLEKGLNKGKPPLLNENEITYMKKLR
ncbi:MULTISPECIES: hypothetical protein [Bacillus]|uniref:hypothetical protein n=1 Tax=Bacillus TaxID=1386 RepID=UPI00030EECC6|nr:MULTISPECIES: hypothetical protein [Bacillus]